MAKRIWLASYGKHVYCCSGRPHSCHNLRLLEADANDDSHPPELVRATDQINEILTELRPQAPAEHHLALIDANVGLLLVWAEKIERPDDLSPYVTAESPQEEINAALGLTGGDRSGA
jgi:hypothetical protein